MQRIYITNPSSARQWRLNTPAGMIVVPGYGAIEVTREVLTQVQSQLDTLGLTAMKTEQEIPASELPKLFHPSRNAASTEEEDLAEAPEASATFPEAPEAPEAPKPSAKKTARKKAAK